MLGHFYLETWPPNLVQNHDSETSVAFICGYSWKSRGGAIAIASIQPTILSPLQGYFRIVTHQRTDNGVSSYGTV